MDGQHHDHHDHDEAHDHDHERDHDAPGLSRRDLLKAGAGAAALLPFLSPASAEALAQMRRNNGPSKLAFFTRAQLATVDALSERIIPADDHSPGAHAARVADFIDLQVSESSADVKKAWTDGLVVLDQASQERFKAPFVKATAEQQVELLTDISRNELAPKTPLEQFFVEAKERTVRGYYTSEVGIHKELQYKGNQFLPEFVGFAEQS